MKLLILTYIIWKQEKHEYTKEEKELQAESVAYVVSNHLGIDTSSYSFGYLANWSSDINTLNHLESSMAIIRDEASKIISRLDQELTQVKQNLQRKILWNLILKKLASNNNRWR